jgi:processive 1,2-diacylglycerol beta-glucosyltransferase
LIKVVLVSASFGDGHRQVGRALREAFEQQGATVYDVDSFQKTNPQLANIQQRMYEWMTRYFAGIYGMTYRWTAKLPVNHFLWRFLALSSSKGVEEAVSRIQPDIVLQLFPDYSTAKLHRLNGKPYIGIVLTDYSVHSHWFHTNADAYFIPDGNLRPNVEPFKTDGIDVVEVGVPVRYQFQQTEISLGHMRPYILFATGGRGIVVPEN